MLEWQKSLAVRGGEQCRKEKQEAKEKGCWTPAVASEHEALEQAAAMVDRYNKIYLRSLRALRDMRRDAPKVVVQNASQVNVGAQQINMNGAAKKAQASAQIEELRPKVNVLGSD
jgi:hypothetical protein